MGELIDLLECLCLETVLAVKVQEQLLHLVLQQMQQLVLHGRAADVAEDGEGLQDRGAAVDEARHLAVRVGLLVLRAPAAPSGPPS